jgi:hypothetical protein
VNVRRGFDRRAHPHRKWHPLIAINRGIRAILSIEKGAPGGRAFAEAFAAWSK